MNIHRLSELSTVVYELNDRMHRDGKYKYVLYKPECAVLLPNQRRCDWYFDEFRTELTNDNAFQHIYWMHRPIYNILCLNDYDDTICSYKTCIKVRFYSTYSVITKNWHVGRVGNIFVEDDIYDDVVGYAKKKCKEILSPDWMTVEVGWFTKEVYRHCRDNPTKKIDSNELDEFFKLFPTT